MSRINAPCRDNLTLCYAHSFLMKLQIRLASLPDRAMQGRRWGKQMGTSGWIFSPPLKPLATQKCHKNSYYYESLLQLAEAKKYLGCGQRSRHNVLAACSITCFYRCQLQTSVHICPGDPPGQQFSLHSIVTK